MEQSTQNSSTSFMNVNFTLPPHEVQCKTFHGVEKVFLLIYLQMGLFLFASTMRDACYKTQVVASVLGQVAFSSLFPAFKTFSYLQSKFQVMLKKLIFILFLFIGLVLNGQEVDALMNDTQVSLLTCDPGTEIYSLFGHSAIRVKNDTKNFDVVFNYGTFNFKTPNFTIKFMRGKLPYHLTVSSYADFLREYHYFKRGVREQVLQINNEQKKEVITFLENNAKPENAEYKYDFFYDNCSSRIRDVFEKTLHYPPQYAGEKDLTFRDLLHRYLQSWPWLGTGIDIIIGSKADKKADPSAQMFIPDKLHDNLASAAIDGRSLLADTYDVLIFERPKDQPWFTPEVVSFILILLIVFLMFKKQDRYLNMLFKAWQIFAILAALLIIFLWFFTDHQATKLNYNLLWLNPLYLVFFTKNKIWQYRTTLLLVVLFIACFLNQYIGLLNQDMPIKSFMWALFLLSFKYNNLKPTPGVQA